MRGDVLCVLKAAGTRIENGTPLSPATLCRGKQVLIECWHASSPSHPVIMTNTVFIFESHSCCTCCGMVLADSSDYLPRFRLTALVLNRLK